jgi:hypothetical protein
VYRILKVEIKAVLPVLELLISHVTMLNAFVATEVSEQVLDMAPFVFHHDNFFIIVIVLIHSSSAVERIAAK